MTNDVFEELDTMDFNEYYTQMFSVLQSLIYKDCDAYNAFFHSKRYTTDSAEFHGGQVIATGYRDAVTGHVIFHDRDRLQVYDREEKCVFSVVVEP